MLQKSVFRSSFIIKFEQVVIQYINSKICNNHVIKVRTYVKCITYICTNNKSLITTKVTKALQIPKSIYLNNIATIEHVVFSRLALSHGSFGHLSLFVLSHLACTLISMGRFLRFKNDDAFFRKYSFEDILL